MSDCSLILSCSCWLFFFFPLSTPAFHPKPLAITAEPITRVSSRRDMFFFSHRCFYSPPRKKERKETTCTKRRQKASKVINQISLYTLRAELEKYRPKHFGKPLTDLSFRPTFKRWDWASWGLTLPLSRRFFSRLVVVQNMRRVNGRTFSSCHGGLLNPVRRDGFRRTKLLILLSDKRLDLPSSHDFQNSASLAVTCFLWLWTVCHATVMLVRQTF